MTTIDSVNPKRLIFAQALAAVPMMGAIVQHYAAAPKADLREEAAEMGTAHAALWGALDRDGIQDPIPVTWMADKPATKGARPRRWLQAWDGRHRTEWALARDLKSVPVRHVTEAEGRALLESSVVGRRHWTKGQLAWLAVNLHPEVCDSKEGRPRKNSDSVGVSSTELGGRFGVSADLISQAVEIYRTFAEAPSLRAKYEPSIWLGHGLGAVLAGIPGGESTAGKPKAATGFRAMAQPLASLNRLGLQYAKWSPDEKSAARDALTTWIRALPPEFRLTLVECVACSSETEDSRE